MYLMCVLFSGACCARNCTTLKYCTTELMSMAKVIHKRGDRRYIYEHKRINGKVVSKYIAPVDDHDETSVLRERIAELEDALRCKTIREARKNAGVVQEVAQHGA